MGNSATACSRLLSTTSSRSTWTVSGRRSTFTTRQSRRPRRRISRARQGPTASWAQCTKMCSKLNLAPKGTSLAVWSWPRHLCREICTAFRGSTRQPLLDELKEDLDALRRAHGEGGLEGLLAHIYSAHPPRNGGTRDTGEKMKKQVMNAIRYYHPDRSVTRHDTSAHDTEKWVVLCEEITKLLNTAWDEEFKQKKSEPE